MNTPFGEPEKLALLQADILLLPNSLIIKETPNPSASLRATHQLELDMKYALADVKVLVTQGKLLDFTILAHPPSPLPISAMLDHIVIEESTSLVNLVKMIIKALQKHHSSLLEGTLMEHVPGDLARLTEMYPEMRYKLVFVEDQLTVVLRFKPDEEISLASVNNLLKAEKLVNTADHCFNIKMEFDPEGKFKIIFQESCSCTSPPSHDRTTSDDLPTPTKYSPLPSPTLPKSKEETGDHDLLVHLVDRLKEENGAPESELIACLARLLTLKVRSSSCCIAHLSLI